MSSRGSLCESTRRAAFANALRHRHDDVRIAGLGFHDREVENGHAVALLDDTARIPGIDLVERFVVVGVVGVQELGDYAPLPALDALPSVARTGHVIAVAV